MTSLTPTVAVNAAIADAKDLPGLIAGVSAINPALATQLESKPLLASRTPWGTVAAGVVAWLSSRYGLGFDETTCSLIAGGGVLLGSYAMRYVTKQPVAGIVTSPVAPADANAATALAALKEAAALEVPKPNP